jgi:hypothetical protein
MRRTRWLWVIGIVAGLGLVAIGVATPFYMFPATDQPAKVDVVYVIGPPTDARVELAEDMLEQGLAGAMMVSITDSTPGDYPKANAACTGERTYPVYCSMPDPFTTRGEARWLKDLAQEHDWDSAAVITFTPHISRARVIMERCFGGELLMLDSGERLAPHSWAYQYLYQTVGFAKVAAMQSC